MRVCLNNNLEYSYLKKADEIKFKWKDRKGIERYHETYPEANFILEHNILSDTEIDYKWVKDTEIIIQKNLILSLNSYEEAKTAKEYGLKFYLNFPITSYYDLNNICELLEPYYVVLGAPLFFDLDNVKKRIDIPIRAIPNVAFDDMPRKNGVVGTWFRPENMEEYEDYIDIIEFKVEPGENKKEQGLYRVYFESKNWPGQLNDIITNLNYEGLNRMIPPEATSKRIDCGQRCERNGICRICYRALELANRELIENYKKEVLDKN